MKVFIDFDEALLVNPIKTELLFTDKKELSCLSYRSKIIYILQHFYKDSEIILLTKKHNNELKLAMTELRVLFNIVVIDAYVVQKITDKILQKIVNNEPYVYIGTYVDDEIKCKTYHFVGSWHYYLYLLIRRKFGNNMKHHFTFFNGWLSMPFISLFNFVLCFLPCWPVVFARYGHINYSVFSGLLCSSFGFVFFFHLLRQILNLQIEKQAIRENREILCAESFILGNHSLLAASFYMFLYLIVGCLALRHSFVGFCCGLFFGIVHFVFMLSSVRILIYILSIVAISLICSFDFVIDFISNVKFLVKL